jgi:hypothetical protein
MPQKGAIKTVVIARRNDEAIFNCLLPLASKIGIKNDISIVLLFNGCQNWEDCHVAAFLAMTASFILIGRAF